MKRVLFNYANAQVRALDSFCTDKIDGYTVIEWILAMMLYNVDDEEIDDALQAVSDGVRGRRQALRQPIEPFMNPRQ